MARKKSKVGRKKGSKVKGAARQYKYVLKKGKLTYAGTLKRK